MYNLTNENLIALKEYLIKNNIIETIDEKAIDEIIDSLACDISNLVSFLEKNNYENESCLALLRKYQFLFDELNENENFNLNQINKFLFE